MRTIPGWLFVLGVISLVAMTGVCGVLAYTTARQTAVTLGETGVQVGVSFDIFAQQQPTATASPTPVPTATPQPVTDPADTEDTDDVATAEAVVEPQGTPDPLAELPELSDPGRKTILLMGIDQRSAVDQERAYRSDTMILVHVNPARRHVGMVSIPRDLYVPVPGYRENQRINTANYLGDLNDYPGGGGPALAAETIRQNFGIRVDNYVRVNFDVFERVVDILAPDGVEICVSEDIYDPRYPDAGFGTIEVRFSVGCQRLNAERLLQYARTRATQGGDFDRARRQQEVLRAAQKELLSVGGITNFITQVPALYRELSENVRTDLTLDEILALGALASTISSDNISSAVIDNRHIRGFAKNPEGADVLIPDWVAIRRLIQSTFNPPQNLTLAELRQRAEAENVTIVVYNNTDVGGLATRTREWLASQGVLNVVNVGNMPETTNAPTTIRDYTGRMWSARYLAALLGIPEDRIVSGNDGLTSADLMIVIGTDIEPLLTSAGGGQ